MKKIGLLCLALVLALGSVGFGYAYWTETLDIGQNEVETGNLDAIFRQAVSNDDGSVGPRFCINGYWMESPYVDIGDNGGDPTAEQTMGVAVSRIANVATTNVTGAHPNGSENVFTIYNGDTTLHKNLTVTMTNTYPSYHPTVFFNMLNAGTIPCKVGSIKLVEVSVGDAKVTVDQVLVVCTTYYVDAETGIITTSANADSDFSIHLSDDKDTLYGVMGSPFQLIDTAAGNLDIHIEAGAEELASYDFVIEIAVVPFNA